MFNQKVRQQVYDKFQGHCAYCGCELKLRSMHVDHKIPLRRGDVDYDPKLYDKELGKLENLYPACQSCNLYKSSMDLEDFRNQLSHIPARIAKQSTIAKIADRFGWLDFHNVPQVEFYFEKADPEFQEKILHQKEALINFIDERQKEIIQGAHRGTFESNPPGSAEVYKSFVYGLEEGCNVGRIAVSKFVENKE